MTLAGVKNAVDAGLNTAERKRPAPDLAKSKRKKSRFAHVDKEDEESSEDETVDSLSDDTNAHSGANQDHFADSVAA